MYNELKILFGQLRLWSQSITPYIVSDLKFLGPRETTIRCIHTSDVQIRAP